MIYGDSNALNLKLGDQLLTQESLNNHGSSLGLGSDEDPAVDTQFLIQGFVGVSDIAEDVDLVAYPLPPGDFNGDGRDDLAIGAPGEDIGAVLDVGAIEVIYDSSTGLSATSVVADQFWTQDSPSVKYTAEESDLFGFVL